MEKRLTDSSGTTLVGQYESVHFCTANPSRWAEVSKILADWRSFITLSPLTNTHKSSYESLYEMECSAVKQAEAEFQLLQEPLFLELSTLLVHKGDEEICFDATNFGPEREEEVSTKFLGSKCINRIVIAFHNGAKISTFEGELSGVIVTPRGNAFSGWDRIFQPTGYQRTISEMIEYSFSINVRNKPYLELGFCLRSHRYEGLFEVHVTCQAEDAEHGKKFSTFCDEINCKPLVIHLPYGEVQEQLMTSSYHRGELLQIQQETYRICQALAQAGYKITRAKIEAMASSQGVPETDEEAAELSPENYFEFHIKLKLPLDYDPVELDETCRRHQAHISRNALKKTPHWQERFVNLRYFKVGRQTAFQRFEDCLRDVSSKYTVIGKQREYAVYDSNIALDRGWISP